MSSDLSGFSMMELFRMEAESHTATLSAGLVSLEGTSAGREVIEPLMRAAHSLKGAARVVGLDAAVRVAHALEDCFVAAQKGKLVLGADHIDVLLQGVDLLVQVSQVNEPEVEAWQVEHSMQIDALVTLLTALTEGQALPQAGPLASSTVPLVPQAAVPADAVTSAGPGQPSAIEEDSAADKTSAGTDSPSVRSVSREQQGRGVATTQSIDPGTIASGDRDRVVRVTAESLTRLMGLAGESLVQTQRLSPLVDALWKLKGRQTGLLESLQTLEDRVSSRGDGFTAADLDQLTKAKTQVASGLQSLGETVELLEEFARVSEDLSSRLHHEVLTSRMRPLADGVRAFPRLVRDLARELGKQARFELLGETTGVDRDILDALEAPLNHLIRNALDHGVEMPEVRRAAGKSTVGTIRLEARIARGCCRSS